MGREPVEIGAVTTTQHAFLIRGARLVQSLGFRAARVPKYRRAGTVAGFPYSEPTGTFEANRLQVSPIGAVLSTGQPSSSFGYVVVDRSAAGVKARVRRIREQEAVAIDALDEQLEATKQHLADLRKQRDAAVRTAWRKANVVRLSEIEERLT